MFDVQIKRIHEYKRQLLACLQVIAHYLALKRDPALDTPPRAYLFAGKAAPGYAMAKLHIKLINDVAAVVNSDPEVRGRLAVAFVPNYGVTLAQSIIPAADVSLQISTAGTEASGTSNMKLALNGALTLGTLDGANVEIREAVGPENFFLFGLDADGVGRVRADGYDPAALIAQSPVLREVLELIESGFFSFGEPSRFRPILDNLKNLGFHYATISGTTIAVSDLTVPIEREQILSEAGATMELAERNYRRGLLTEDAEPVAGPVGPARRDGREIRRRQEARWGRSSTARFHQPEGCGFFAWTCTQRRSTPTIVTGTLTTGLRAQYFGAACGRSARPGRAFGAGP
jgi:hypothetical protein